MPQLVQFLTRVPPHIKTAVEQTALEQRALGHGPLSDNGKLLVAVLSTFFSAVAVSRANTGVDPHRTFGDAFADLYQQMLPDKE